MVTEDLLWKLDVEAHNQTALFSLIDCLNVRLGVDNYFTGWCKRHTFICDNKSGLRSYQFIGGNAERAAIESNDFDWLRGKGLK